MNESPGWNGCEWVMLSGYTGPIFMDYPSVYHLWKATQEQRDLRCQMFENSSAATWHYGLCLDHIGCNNLAKWTVGGRG